MKNLFSPMTLAAMFALATTLTGAAETDAAIEKARVKILREKKPAELTADDVKTLGLPRCFRDKNNNGVCDNSKADKRGCPRDCQLPNYDGEKENTDKKDSTPKTSSKKDPKTAAVNPCSGCNGDCSRCGLI